MSENRIAAILLEEAQRAVLRAQESAPALQAQLLEMETRKIAINAELDAANLKPQRLLDYRYRLGAYFQCPRCWIDKEVRAILSPAIRDHGDDVLTCYACGADYIIPNR